MKRILVFSLFLGIVLNACKKESSNDPDPDPDPPVVSEADKLKDTALLVAKDLYLWYDKIPASLDPRTFADPNGVMEGIRPYSIEPGFTDPVDRWSFAVTQAEWDNTSGGISGDLGIGIFFMSSNDLRVTNVEKESVAGLAGVQRTWQITKINGNSTINTTDASINFIVDAIYGGQKADITFKKPDGTSVDLSLTPSSYNEHPLVLDSIYNVGGKNIGYLVLNSFLGDTTAIKAGFNTIFTKFAAKNVTDIIVDLRYNGGGYVSLQERLADYLVPSGENGKLMYTQSFNDKFSEYNESSYFEKTGSVNPTKVVFIITQNTASASESLINIMTPHVDVKKVGPSNSHGKPVGFFPYPVGEWYVFPVSLRIINSAGVGNYFDGFEPDSQVRDGLDKPWGDLNEDCLASAVKYLSTGSFRLSADKDRNNPENLRAYNSMRSQKPSLMVGSRGRIPTLH